MPEVFSCRPSYPEYFAGCLTVSFMHCTSLFVSCISEAPPINSVESGLSIGVFIRIRMVAAECFRLIWELPS